MRCLTFLKADEKKSATPEKRATGGKELKKSRLAEKLYAKRQHGKQATNAPAHHIGGKSGYYGKKRGDRLRGNFTYSAPRAKMEKERDLAEVRGGTEAAVEKKTQP